MTRSPLPAHPKRGRAAPTWRAATVGAAVFVLVLFALCLPARAGNPDALWNIVHGRCVPDQEKHADPAPCTLVDLSGGVADGYVVLKDRVGVTQFLVLPTARLSGIESPALLSPGVPDYMQDAWAARRFVRARAPGPLGRDDLSLAVNSVYGRTQNQLHIHIDCLKPAVRSALDTGRSAVGDHWQKFPALLAGHWYFARRLRRPDLTGIDVFALLARSSAAARTDMGAYTIVVAGAFFDGQPGFILLASRADPGHGNPGSGESLQDHTCALARHGP